MKRTFKYALAVVLGATMVAPAMAQDQFPDVPASHWAYKELLELKSAGLLVGYPDGLFRGGRPASRYELAVAIHAVWMNLKGQQDALKAQIDDLSKRMDGMASKADLDALKAQIDALQAEVGRIKSEDIAKLNRLTDEFKAELTKMGANVDEIKKGLAALEGRVSAIEKRLPSFDVSGSGNMVALGGYGTNHRFGVSLDGRPTGVGRGSSNSDLMGANKDLTALYDAQFTLKSHDAEGANFHWKATIGASNMFLRSGRFVDGGFSSGQPFGSQSSTLNGVPFQEGQMDLYFQEFNAWWDFSLGGQKATATVGRFGTQAGSYFFRRPDTTPYYENTFWDNGDWMIDGGKISMAFGGNSSLNIFGGRKSNQLTTNGVEIQPMEAGRFGAMYFPGFNDRPRGYNGGDISIDQLLGANAKIGLGKTASIGLVYIDLDSNQVFNLGTTANPILANGVRVWGGNVMWNGGPFSAGATYSRSDVKYNQTAVIDDHNSAFDVRVRYDAPSKQWGIGAGYRTIDPRFAAPGYWGRIGMWWNPTDIRGFWVNGMVKIGKGEVNLGGGFYTGLGGSFSGLGTDDKLTRLFADFKYPIGPKCDLNFGFERVNWDLAQRGNFPRAKPYEQWIYIGGSHKFSDKASFDLFWEMSDVDGKTAWNAIRNWNSSRATGGLLSTQLTFRF